jgi:hypothetical protein
MTSATQASYQGFATTTALPYRAKRGFWRARPGNTLYAAGAALLVAVALGRIHLRVQTTLVGYDLGGLKAEEAKLLEERGFLKMQLAKLTTKKHLQLMSETGDDQPAPGRGTYAQK